MNNAQQKAYNEVLEQALHVGDTDEGIARIIIDMLWPDYDKMPVKVKNMRWSLQVKDYDRNPR